MKTVNIHEAKTHLSRLVEEAANGEAFVIAKAGKPMVKVVPLEEAPAEEPKKKRRIGFLKGQISVPDDFDTMFAKEIEDMFYGEHK
ncbi:type II toxin-antitoxin system Phd/YefM family antitoxin [Neorhizobium galegae]|uniref:type II toxin-antitoxin system Phd/YefM family antitoxin n=1 Tax=Neorhizobium galegae TaxID=399 RepID=UPI000621A498|nr:type II toxin-antitoxin system prevent-host-death family antitoxin [Neorhizobium galegae]CDZ26397.1 Prevent-host-death family protein [Neorhizobium galegae bv. officinalis]KAA9385767.1 type II toxin-antitoxin system Phd/YefM family antitoxin [Neorhizobium galegae]KAB1112537.1 type II toxin-antitoxin system Phd/YefM family antitoxin [Neorhizobium galegae]MCM2497291.1 type II toxin-antitoxin system prevent-host-death family antitoxin [Neorhizobium galegae]MCQ1763946.1 type II toxin-antitoxin 